MCVCRRGAAAAEGAGDGEEDDEEDEDECLLWFSLVFFTRSLLALV